MLQRHILSPGTVLGEFVVERPLASGGMCSVYVVRQQSTQKLRALKLLAPELVEEPKVCEGFLREATIGSVIDSDHVVQVLAAGIDQQLGLPWLVMELLDGQDLSEYIARSGPAPRLLVTKVFREVFHALGQAHKSGIVHRDLKPDNIFLHRSRHARDSLTIKVLDFGIAKILSSSSVVTRTRTIGTPGWMAPEQCSAGQVSPATDVWALGLLGFYLLTGKSFWLMMHNPDADMMAVLKEVVFDPLPSATERAAELGVGHLLPGWFEPWFAKCVVREPKLRFPDANAAWRVLEPSLEMPFGVRLGPSLAESRDEALSQSVGADSHPEPSSASYVPPGVARPNAVPEAPPLPLPSPAPAPPAPLSPTADVPLAEMPFRSSLMGARLTPAVWAQGTGATPAVQPSPDVPSSRPSESRRRAMVLGALGAATLLGAGLGALLFGGPKPEAQLSSQPGGVASTKTVLAALSASNGPAEMVHIPAGLALVDGSTVSVPPFELDTTEVTVGDWDQCAEKGACAGTTDTVEVAWLSEGEKRFWSRYCNHPKAAERKQHPLNCVSFGQAQSYCKSKGKRLPSLSEWLRAAYRAGADTERKYPWGDTEPSDKRLNACGEECVGQLGEEDKGHTLVLKGLNDGAKGTSAVGSYSAGDTPLGLKDMAGNVREWTSSPGPAPEEKIVVGGGWYDTEPKAFTAQGAKAIDETMRHTNVGFRCAR